VYASSTRVGHVTGGGSLSRSATICGARSYRVRVTELRGKGSFHLSVSTPS
jgi:hypothetical protein